MSEPGELHPVVERTREMVRHANILRARNVLMDLTRPILADTAKADLEKEFPADPDHFFDNFRKSAYHPDLNILSCNFSECDRELPGQNGTGAKLVYTNSYDDEDEINQRPEDVPDDEEWYPDEDPSYVETRCWLLGPTIALLVTTRMGTYDDNDNNASGDFEIVHCDNRQVLRAFIENMMSDYPDQSEKGRAALDEVLGADSASPEPFRAAGARQQP